MHAAPRHGTPSLTSLPKDGGVSCFWSFIWKVAHPVSDRTQPCLTSVKLMVLAGPIGHSPLFIISAAVEASQYSLRYEACSI